MIGGQRQVFGVSGLLYQNNLLLFDRRTGSLWSQLLSEAVTGPLAGTKLHPLPAEDTSWESWQGRHPGTLALSFATGYHRDYHQDPYAAYHLDRAPALLVEAGGEIEIFPFAQLRKARAPLTAALAGRRFIIYFDRQTKAARVQSEASGSITWLVGFQHELRHFFPKAQLYRFHKSRR